MKQFKTGETVYPLGKPIKSVGLYESSYTHKLVPGERMQIFTQLTREHYLCFYASLSDRGIPGPFLIFKHDKLFKSVSERLRAGAIKKNG